MPFTSQTERQHSRRNCQYFKRQVPSRQEISAERATPAQKLEVYPLMRLCYEIRQAELLGKTDRRFPVYASSGTAAMFRGTMCGIPCSIN